MATSYKYKLILSYDGTRYGGWQIQSNATAIQTLINRALSIALRKEIAVVGSGRTDAGVHALGQTAHFEHDSPIDCFRLLASLNGLLPEDIRAIQLEAVSSDFHARYSAVGKVYRYHLHLGKVMSPFKRLYSTHILYPLDIQLLKEAAALFLGTHDFTAFANEAHSGSAAKNPVRTLYRLDIKEEEGGIYLEFQGDGFLYKMVRNIVGTLLEVASHKIAIQDIPVIFASKDRKQAGSAAPPQGLFLVTVLYKETDSIDSK